MSDADIEDLAVSVKRALGVRAFVAWACAEAQSFERAERASGRPVPDRRAEGVPLYWFPPVPPAPVSPVSFEPEPVPMEADPPLAEGANSPEEAAPAGPPAFSLFEDGRPVLEAPPGGWTPRELAEAKRRAFPDETDRGPRRDSLASRRF